MKSRLIAAGAALVLLALGSGASGATTGGTALENGGEGALHSLGFETFVTGKGYWFTCPTPTNTSSQPIEVLDVELVRAPAHWKTGEVRAVDTLAIGALPLGASDDDFGKTPGMEKDHSGAPVRIAPGERSPIVHLVRTEPVSSAAGRAEGCRFTYRSAHRVYVEDPGADFFFGPYPD
ncbi:hypothetical protein [Streptomyces sp. NPDC000229]|uniref:hypothetical protein n=1 Tax=Streptomyces sp. NPDC000229 TaxID=3154247 RepID=UPI0033260AA0